MSWSRIFGEGLVVLTVAAGVVAILSATTNEMAPQWDMAAYRDMAANGLIGNQGLIGPWAFRPAAPLIVGAISRRTGLSIADTFRLSVRLTSVALIVLCFLFARRLGAKPAYALWIAVVLLLYAKSIKWELFAVSMVDIYAYPVFLLAFYALWKGRLWLALAIAAPGLLFKEFLLVPLLTVACVWTYNYWGNWRRIAHLLAPVGASLIVFLLLPRALIHVQANSDTTISLTHPRSLILLIRYTLDPHQWVEILFAYIWFWLPILMLVDRARLAALWKRLAPQAPLLLIFSALHFLLLMYGGTGTFIYVAYSLPAAILVMAYLLEDRRPHWLELVLITGTVVIFNRDFSPIPLPEQDFGRFIRYYDVSLLRFSELLACIAAAALLRRLIPIFNTSRPSSNTRRLTAAR